MSRVEYPRAERLDLAEELHGVTVADPYRWLEDPADPRTVEWEAAQDTLLDAARAGWTTRGLFADRLTALLRTGTVSAPEWHGDRCFLKRRTPEQEHDVYLTIDPDGTERVLIDPMVLDPAGTTTLDGAVPSKEGHLLAYLISSNGTEESELYVMDVATGENVDGPITRARYSPVAWLPGGKSFYYVRREAADQVPAGEEQYHRRVRLHQVGTDPDSDPEILGAGLNLTNYYWMTVPRSGDWLAVYAGPGTAPRNDAWVAPLSGGADPAAPALVPVQVGVDAQTAFRFPGPDSPLAGLVLVQTDRDAPRGRICVADVDDLDHGSWRTLVAEDPEAVLNEYELIDAADGSPLLVVHRTRHAVSELTLHDARTGERIGAVELPSLGTVGTLSSRSDGGTELWFEYSDFTTPTRVYRYDAATPDAAPTVWADAPGAVDLTAVRTRQVTYRSKDGTTIRMFVLDDGRDPAETGPRPTILYGYGGFNIAQGPAFTPRVLAWVQAGGVFAIANLRGGSEEGEEWHRAGMMANKQNVFDDFHAAGDWLVDAGVTTRAQLGVFGGSNGGLLVGAALTQHPEKYAAVVCWAPLLDMIRYERFGLGVTWNEEYGTAADPEQFGWLRAYSPYHNVHEGTDYPATLFTVFDGDTRVDPLHARKLAAQLQHATAGDRPILYRMERSAGHGGRAVSKVVGVYSEMWAFMADRLGLAAE